MAIGEMVHETALSENGALKIPVDAEHAGIRTLGCVSLLVSLPLSFTLLSLILPNQWIINGILSLAIAVGFTHILDRILRARWPSGRHVVADDTQIAITLNDDVQFSVDPQKQVNPLMWRFRVNRSGRVRKGWYVIGLALEQDGEHLPVYSFIPPDDLDNLPLSNGFKLLERKKTVDGRSEREMKLAGEQRRLHAAEQVRGLHGAEMTLDEFKTFMTYLQDNYPRWMPRR